MLYPGIQGSKVEVVLPAGDVAENCRDQERNRYQAHERRHRQFGRKELASQEWSGHSTDPAYSDRHAGALVPASRRIHDRREYRNIHMTGIDEERAGEEERHKTRGGEASHENNACGSDDIQDGAPPEAGLVKIKAAQQASDRDQYPIRARDKSGIRSAEALHNQQLRRP